MEGADITAQTRIQKSATEKSPAAQKNLGAPPRTKLEPG